MKYSIFLLFICHFNSCLSQEIRVNYFSTFSGRNLTAQYNFEFEKSELLFGLGYNINRFVDNFNRNQAFFKRLNASSALNRLNINVAYTKNILKKDKPFAMSFLSDFQAKYSGTKTTVFQPVGYDSLLVVNAPEEGILYREIIQENGPYFWLEGTLGVQFKFPISERIKLVQQAGLGLSLIRGKQNEAVLINTDFSLHYFLSWGLAYQLKRKNTKEIPN